MAAIIAGAAVVTLAAGSAYALVTHGGKDAAQPPAHPTARAKASQAASVSASSAPATPTAAASAVASGSPAPTAKAPAGLAVAPGLSANPATAGAARLLNHYFHAINTRDYAEYSSLLDARMLAGESASSFASGYATTRDSAEELVALSPSGGDEAATVSFTSHQSPADSANGSSCTDWTITLFLAPRGNGYVITQPPSGYRSSYQNCP